MNHDYKRDTLTFKECSIEMLQKTDLFSDSFDQCGLEIGSELPWTKFELRVDQ